MKLLLDNQTRWNSQYISISRALKLRDRIYLFQQHHLKELDEDALSAEDFTRLEDLKEMLAQFLLCTNKVQGEEGSLHQWLLLIEALYNYLERQITGFK